MSIGARMRSGVSVPGVVELVVFCTALAPRLGLIVRSGGPSGTYGYDPSVYYAAADAFVHQRMPYRDFILLHPPGIMLFLSPFAALGNVTTDGVGFAAACLAFVVLGAVNAVLVTRVATRSGFGRGAALAGGLVYALWPGTADTEFTIELETLGSFLILASLLAYWRAEQSGSRRWPVLCGVAAAAAASVKIWSLVPLLLLAAWHLAPARRRRLPFFLAGAAGGLLVLNGPFYAIAPHQMSSMVITDQLARGHYVPAAVRLPGLTGMQMVDARLANQHPALVVAVAALVLLALIVLALRVRGGAFPVALLLASAAVLISAPPWFGHYDGFLAPGLALTAAAAWSAVRASLPLRRAVAIAAVPAVAAALVAVTVLPRAPLRPYPSVAFGRDVRSLHCVMSDAPMPLIEMDVLSRDLRNGCPNWVDVTGRTYEPGGPQGNLVARADNPRWQRALVAYLSSGQALTMYRSAYTGIGPLLRHLLHRYRVLARGRGYTLYST